jgi:hypothetical protein
MSTSRSCRLAGPLAGRYERCDRAIRCPKQAQPAGLQPLTSHDVWDNVWVWLRIYTLMKNFWRKP